MIYQVKVIGFDLFFIMQFCTVKNKPAKESLPAYPFGQAGYNSSNLLYGGLLQPVNLFVSDRQRTLANDLLPPMLAE